MTERERERQRGREKERERKREGEREMSNKVLEVLVLTHHLVPCDLSLNELVGSQQEVDTPSVLTH